MIYTNHPSIKMEYFRFSTLLSVKTCRFKCINTCLVAKFRRNSKEISDILAFLNLVEWENIQTSLILNDTLYEDHFSVFFVVVEKLDFAIKIQSNVIHRYKRLPSNVSSIFRMTHFRRT